MIYTGTSACQYIVFLYPTFSIRLPVLHGRVTGRNSYSGGIGFDRSNQLDSPTYTN